MKRALNPAPDAGNAAPVPTNILSGQENSGNISPVENRGLERKSFEKGQRMFSLDGNAPVNHALSRLGGDGSNDCHMTSTTSSPLKRSDADMNLDQASLGSPVAKRRSLHGSASFGDHFNVFDHGPSSSPQFEIHDDSTQTHEYELSAGSITSDNSISSFTSMPRRSSSLRKSTLQQRQAEKTSWGRRRAAEILAAQNANQASNAAPEMMSPSLTRNRPRLSLDQFVPPLARDSPFSSPGLLNPSVHMLSQPTHQPHPLSRAMSTSSSSSSLPDDSPTHVPVHFGENHKPRIDFSKSLPAGSLRPFNLDAPSDNGSFSTPKNYKSAKPLPAAFMSTGLVSKVNRNPEQPINHGTSVNVPDTPCKKHIGLSNLPAEVPGSAIARARHIRHSFGAPSTPFNPHDTQPVSGTFGKPNGVFGGSGLGNGGLTRRGSFLSVDGDENGGSPDSKGESQGSNDYDFPPTPTKQVPSTHIQPNGSPSNHRRFFASPSVASFGLTSRLPRTTSKLNLSTSPSEQGGEDSDTSMDINDSPTPASFGISLTSSISMPSFGRSRALRGSTSNSPSPVITKSHTISFLSPSRKPGFAKISHVAPASPLERVDFIERLSPRTPHDSMLPPDPSGLSISNHRESQPMFRNINGNAIMPPPATPTTGRDYFSRKDGKRLSTTPVSGSETTDMDDSLRSRFEKHELIGGGEFSKVFKVFQPLPISITPFHFSASDSPLPSRSPATPMPERVFAVKKMNKPFQGARDRQKKLEEVRVLKALGRTDHIIHLIDSWEYNSMLYIQTEYCEEGALDLWIDRNSNRGRLDDFRIWKIILEVGEASNSI